MRAREPDGRSERVLGNVFIGPGVELESWDEDVVPPFDGPCTSTEGWARLIREFAGSLPAGGPA